MSTHKLNLGVAIASTIAMVMLISGCQTQSVKALPKAPAVVPKGTLTVLGQYYGYVYIDGEWKVLPNDASANGGPSDAFQSLDFSPKGMLTATTVGSNDNALVGNEIGLWTYDKRWRQATINGDTNVSLYVWSPSNVLYAVPDDGQVAGIWYVSKNSWKSVKGSSALGYINSIEISPKGTLTVTSQASNGAASVWQDLNGKWTRLTTGNEAFAADGLQVKWSPTGVLTLGTSQHGVWQYVDGAWRQPGGVASPIADVTQLSWSSQGTLVISGDSSNSAGLWEMENGQWSRVDGANSPIAKDGIRQFGWSPSGVLTVSDSTNGHIYQYQNGKWTDIWSKSASNGQDPVAPTFGWSPQGVLVCNGGNMDGLWQYQNGKWTEIGGQNSPIKNQSSLLFGWSDGTN
ncbi:WD40 repeat domain-containing protein [Alicyclobacillus fodiniaquatilis]|jgi:WD40 repeat protein|uniref:WD40 repeat domain-containing protein n=1 Tax=Alicyclobacillus fodiniaquatilis TaxID=1661150 RepID=A0ABW4JDP3_9BACL